MKRLKKICNPIFIVILLIALSPFTALAGVTGDEPWYGTTAVTVYSSLTNLTSTNPLKPYLPSSVPSSSYTAILSAESGYSLPSSITVQRVSFDPPNPEIVEQTYILNTDYTYNESTGEIVIPVTTLDDIVFAESTFHIRIIASGVANTVSYRIDVTQNSNGTISPSVADNISHGSDFTFIFNPDEGYFVADVLADGESVGDVSSYTFTNIISNHTITAIFEKSSETPSPPETQTTSDDTFADIPNTGDSSNTSFLYALMLLSGAGILGTVLNSKNRQYRLEKK
jgi:LPXTG-motif cell wall-anchored protein